MKSGCPILQKTVTFNSEKSQKVTCDGQREPSFCDYRNLEIFSINQLKVFPFDSFSKYLKFNLLK